MPNMSQTNASSEQMHRLLSTTEAAKYLGVTGTTIRRLIYAGEIPVIRRFKHYKVDREDLIAFIAAEKDVL